MSENVTSQLGHLRAIRPDELEMMLSWRNSPTVRANMYTRHEISLSEHLAWWARIQDRADQRYLMYEFEGIAAGVVAFNSIDVGNCNSSWAFYASPEAMKGTGSRMEFLALDHAFRDLQIHKLFCEVLAFNGPVVKLHQKFGFQVEGILREQHRMNAEFVDIYRLGMLGRDWQQNREAMLAKLMRLSKG